MYIEKKMFLTEQETLHTQHCLKENRKKERKKKQINLRKTDLLPYTVADFLFVSAN